jgi:heterodisulfide reductase subunit A-like polyferredoxin
MVNIRDQCSWVHAHEKEEATKKAKDLVRMAVAKARLIQALDEPVIDVVPKGLIIGGGLAGMTAALSLADQGFESFLIEKTGQLGGNLHNIHYTLEGEDPQDYLKQVVDLVREHKLIHVFTEAEIESVNGFVGNFQTIIATGAVSFRPDEYMYGKNDHVVLQHELEGQLASSRFVPGDKDSVVMIQCVGSRDDKHRYCSSICCSMAIKNALKIKEINPSTNVYILYRDAIVPPNNEALEQVLPVPRSEDGFLLESHVQLKPVDSYIDGIYICGMSQFPKPIDESIAQAKAAASKASILLARGYVKAEPVVSSCDPDICIGCGICEYFCPYNAIKMTKKGKRKKAEVIIAACKGCGVCASYCPTRAISMGRFTDDQILRKKSSLR